MIPLMPAPPPPFKGAPPDPGTPAQVRVDGTPVEPVLLAAVLAELRDWAARNTDVQERPMVRAQTYMILRSPAEFEAKIGQGSGTAFRHRKKFEQNRALWGAAAAALRAVDAGFAAEFTALAVTHNFRGSPHIDTTNVGPFYGLSVGDFAEGTGGIRVEVDALTVAEVNTRGRLAKVDGRFPHWVAPYDAACERFSLIFYRTEGAVTPKTTAVFGPVSDGGG